MTLKLGVVGKGKPAPQRHREAWASAIATIVYLSDEMDIRTAAALARLAITISGDGVDE